MADGGAFPARFYCIIVSTIKDVLTKYWQYGTASIQEMTCWDPAIFVQGNVHEAKGEKRQPCRSMTDAQTLR